MTSCQNQEANTIDGIVERVFDKKDMKLWNFIWTFLVQ